MSQASAAVGQASVAAGQAKAAIELYDQVGAATIEDLHAWRGRTCSSSRGPARCPC